VEGWPVHEAHAALVRELHAALAMATRAATLDVSILARPPGVVAVAGSAVGALLIVSTLFTVLYANAPWWVAAWMGTCGALLVTSGIWAWRAPHDVNKALLLGAAIATTGVGSSMPAVRMWIQVGAGDAALGRADIAAAGVTLGLLCACYLSFAAADLVRAAWLSAMARRAGAAARPSV
jgi:hypothetical protein